MGGYNGAASTRFFADWNLTQTDPNDDFAFDHQSLSARAWDLWRNDPYYHALIETEVEGVVGPDGLRFRSLYQEDDSRDTDATEQTHRTQIDAAVRRATARNRLDAGGAMTYPEMSEHTFRSAKVVGDGYGVRVWKPSRHDAYQGTAWRIVDAARVCNPGYGANTDRMFEGHELNADGVTVAIHVQKSHPNITRIAPSSDWMRIPIYGPDGQRQVTHRRNGCRPEQIRGLGSAAPVLLYLRMLQGTTEAWAIAKRIQASYALMIKTEDPKEAARGDRHGAVLSGTVPIKPGMRYYHNHDEVTPLNFNFQGNDYEMFRNPIIEAVCAAEGVPYEVVLKRLTKSNMASSRAALLTYYQFCRREQNRQIGSCESVWIESIIREELARDRLALRSEDWDEITRGRWLRAPRVWPDPQREAQAARAWVDMGRSMTSVYDEAGFDFEDEILQRARDNSFMEAQKVSISGETIGERIITEPREVIDPNTGEVRGDDSEDGSEEEVKEPEEQEAEMTRNEFRTALADAMQFASLRANPQPAPNMHFNLQLPAEVVAMMPVPAAPVVHMAAPIINVNPTPVHVDAPAITVQALATSPAVHVHAAEQAAPVVNITVPVPSVTNDVRVEVPARTVIAKPQRDGSVRMEPQ